MEKIILASQSPRRKQLLEWAEIPFDILVKETDEQYPDHLSIENIPIYIARNKALVIESILRAPRTILAADTIVVLDNKVIGKPVDRADAISILTALSGKNLSLIHI